MIYKITHLGWSGNLKPSSDHAIDGVGFPDALHFNDTVGPGCSVCSMNVYSIIGGASGEQQFIALVNKIKLFSFLFFILTMVVLIIKSHWLCTKYYFCTFASEKFISK